MHHIDAAAMPLDVLPDPHVVIADDGRLLRANAAFDHRLLQSPQAVAHLARATERRFDLAVDLGGARHVFAVTWTPCRWQGEAARLVRLLEVTAERRETQLLLHNVHVLEDVVDALPASLLILDADGVIVSGNARWHVSAQANGLSAPNAGMGENYLAVCDRAAAAGDGEAARVAAGLREVLARRAMAFDMEYSLPTPDGRLQWYSLSINALPSSPGATVQHYETTEVHDQQQVNLEALAHFRAVFEGALDGIVIYDDALQVLSANDAAVRLVGLRDVEALPLLHDFVPREEAERLQRYHDELLAQGEVRGLLQLRQELGGTREVEFAARANVVPGRHVAVVRDKTAARALEDQLRQSQKMEALGQLTGGIAHDFNNLLTVIVAHSDLLLAEAGLSDDVHEGLSQILRASQRGADMVRKLMAFGRREQLRPEPTYLDAAVQELAGILRRLLPETIEVTCEVQPNTPPVLADVTAVQQILLNLATNARDAMRERGGVLHVQVARAPGSAQLPTTPGPGTGTQHVIVSVRDNGTGMSPEVLAHMFEPFFTTKAPGEGTGLGMAMVYGLMDQMGGHVTVESQPGQGTVVHLHFPEVTVPPGLPSTLSPAVRAPGHGFEQILLVEDDDAIRVLTARILERAGYGVVAASCGDDAAAHLEARQLAAQPPFDLVVSDVVMPHGDGYRVLQAVQRFAPQGRIVWVTGYPGAGLGDGPVHAPCDAPIIQKPWTTNEFLTRIRAALDGPPNVPSDTTALHDSVS